jgi:hypothetical protein
VVAGADWSRRWLMAKHPGGREWRGISSTAMSLRGRDYLDATAGRSGIEEVVIAEAVRDAGFTYTVDHDVFCHHINYFPVRPLGLANGELLSRWHRLLLDHWSETAPAVERQIG